MEKVAHNSSFLCSLRTENLVISVAFNKVTQTTRKRKYTKQEYSREEDPRF